MREAGASGVFTFEGPWDVFAPLVLAADATSLPEVLGDAAVWCDPGDHDGLVDALVRALPPTVRSIAVLDRTKEPGAVGGRQDLGEERGGVALLRCVEGLKKLKLEGDEALGVQLVEKILDMPMRRIAGG